MPKISLLLFPEVNHGRRTGIRKAWRRKKKKKRGEDIEREERSEEKMRRNKEYVRRKRKVTEAETDQRSLCRISIK